MSGDVEAVTGNRQVLQIDIPRPRADPRGARAEACAEVGLRGKHGFARAKEPEAEEVAA